MATRRDPKSAHAALGRARVWAERKDYAQARAEYARARELGPQDLDVLNGLAWFAATCPDDASRDGRQAVLDATRACERTFWKAEMTLDTLAAAYAEVGDFAQAVKYQRQALECGELPASVQPKAEARLALYQQGKPYRE